MAIVCPHAATDLRSGLSISDDADGTVSITGLAVSDDQRLALEELVGLWKYGMMEGSDAEAAFAA
jgi:hypothetical protein